METTSTDAFTMRVASQTGSPTPKGLGNAVSALGSPQDVGEPVTATNVEDDDISPDDAPEIMLDDDDREVRAFVSVGVMKQHY